MSKTKEITTTSGLKAVIKTSITYGDHQEIVGIWMDEEKSAKSELLKKANKAGVEKVVVSLDGSEEAIYERFNNLDLEDGSEIMVEVTAVLNPKAGGKTSSPTSQAETSEAKS
jgi:myo-inositol-hexaphosphate 3-phosphohydrolase